MVSPCAQSDLGSGHQNSCGGDGPNHEERVQRLGLRQGGSLHAHQQIDGHAFRVRAERSKLLQKSNTVFVPLSHADDPSATDRHVRLADRGKSPEPVVIGSCRDDLAIVLWGSIQIVVVSRQSGLCQAVRLRLGEHTKRAANFHSQAGNGADDFQDPIKFLALGGLPPRRPHAKSRRSLSLGPARRLDNLAQG